MFSCHRKYIKTVLNSFLLFLILSAFCYCQYFFSFFCKNMIPGFHGFMVKLMTSWSFWIYKSDYRSHRISGACEQSFWNSRFYMVCRVKANGALKPEYLLKCWKREKSCWCYWKWWCWWKEKTLSKQPSHMNMSFP